MTDRALPRLAKLGYQYDVSAAGPERWATMLERFPEMPTSRQELLSHVDMLAGRADMPPKGRRRVVKDLALGLKNPDLQPTDLEVIDNYFADTKPTFGGQKMSKNFWVYYVNDPSDTVNYITDELAQQIADKLDEHYASYSSLFNKAPLLNRTATGTGPDAKKLQVVQVYELSDDNDGVSSYDGPMELSTSSMKVASNLAFTTAHELFHFLEFAYGVDAKLDAPSSQDWFVEGMANWGAVYLTKGTVDHGWDDFSNFATVSIFDATYDAFPFWIYISGFQNSGFSSSPVWPIQSFLDAYEKSGGTSLDPDGLPYGNAIDSLQKVLNIAATNISPPMKPGLAQLVASYNRAKCSEAWRSAGQGYDRANKPMDWVSGLTDYRNGRPFDPKSVRYTATGTMGGEIGKQFTFGGKIKKGCVNIFQLGLAPPASTQSMLEIELLSQIENAAFELCLSSIKAKTVVARSDIVGVKGQWQKTVTHMPYGDAAAEFAAIAVADGSVGTSQELDGTCMVTVKVVAGS